MTRRKVPLQFITNDSSRKVTFKKRKKGLIKKVSELSTLCGIDACAIIYSPFSNEPEVWPSPDEARQVIAKFRNLSEMDRSKGMVNQQGFLRQRMDKADMQLKKTQRDNRDKEVTQFMLHTLTAVPTALIGLNASNLNEINSSAGKTLHDIEDRIRTLKENPSLQQEVPHQQQLHQLGSVSFEPQQGFDVRVPDQGIQMEGQVDHGFNFETMMMEQQQQQWSYMDMLRPTEIFGNAGVGGGLGFGNNEELEEEANITNAIMMMQMQQMPSSSSSSSSMGMQMPINNPNAAFSSSWPNFHYP